MERVCTVISAIMLFLWLCSVPVYALQDEVFVRLGRGAIYDVAFSPDSEILAVLTPKGIYFHSPADFADLAFIDPGGHSVGFSHNTHSICFSPDGQMLASSTLDRTGMVILWDAVTHEKIAEIRAEKYPGRTRSIRFSPDGRLIAFGDDHGAIRLLDVVEQKEIGVL